MFHPVTLEDHTGFVQVKELMAALDMFQYLRFIITKSNSDAGGREINAAWVDYANKCGNCLLVDSLGADRYISLLPYSCMMIGNSSSGILEGPASKIPTINIGNRQNGRIKATSVIDCEPQKESIALAMSKALTPEFQKLAKETVNPYGDGHTSEKILAVIRDFLHNNKLKIAKEFHELENFDTP